MTALLSRDLDDILAHSADDLAALRGARLFVTGGTGFVGSWLLESFLWANRRLALGSSAVVLTRDPTAYTAALPHIACDPAITLVAGDVRKASLACGSFDVAIHAATPASAKVNDEEPLLMIDTIVDGAKAVLEVACRNGAIPALFTSSGAVYGRQPPDLPLLDEDYRGAPDPLDQKNAYHEAKRVAELLFAIAHKQYGLQSKIARMFAFVGPYLPIDRHFAIGNFIGDALAGKTIEISGDGTAMRTYLYAADMASWLWRVLVRGEAARAYNVGSEAAVSIRETAESVAVSQNPKGTVTVRKRAVEGAIPERYVCSTQRARTELRLAEWTSLEEAIRRTITWHRARSASIRS